MEFWVEDYCPHVLGRWPGKQNETFLEREKDTDIQIIQGNAITDSKTLRLLTNA